MNLENMLIERSHTQKGTYYTPFIWMGKPMETESED